MFACARSSNGSSACRRSTGRTSGRTDSLAGQLWDATEDEAAEARVPGEGGAAHLLRSTTAVPRGHAAAPGTRIPVPASKCAPVKHGADVLPPPQRVLAAAALAEALLHPTATSSGCCDHPVGADDAATEVVCGASAVKLAPEHAAATAASAGAAADSTEARDDSSASSKPVADGSAGSRPSSRAASPGAPAKDCAPPDGKGDGAQSCQNVALTPAPEQRSGQGQQPVPPTGRPPGPAAAGAAAREGGEQAARRSQFLAAWRLQAWREAQESLFLAELQVEEAAPSSALPQASFWIHFCSRAQGR